MSTPLHNLFLNGSIFQGISTIYNGESPALFAKVLGQRLPRRVKAKRRVVCYDNCCNFMKFCLRRYPWRVRKFLFVVDRAHLPNHKHCSESYNMDMYPDLKDINSQVAAEQRNRSLRKLTPTLAYYSFPNYLRILQLFFSYTNLKQKGIIKKTSF